MTLAVLLFVLALTAVEPSRQAERASVLQLARQELEAGRRGEAKRLLADAADRFDSVQALLHLSRLQSGDGDAAGALESLRRARALAPNSEDVLGAFAQMSLAAGAPVPAIVALDALTRMHPSVAQYHYLRGIALMRAGDRVDAVEALRAAERLEADRALTLLALGIALNNLQRYNEARPVLARGLELEPDNSEALAALAEAEHGAGDRDAALKHAGQARAKSTGNATAHLVLGLVAMDNAQYAEARTALERAVAADPLSVKARYQLSIACSRLGDEASAQKHLEVYRQTLRDMEKRIEELRRATGPSRGEPRRK
jgi:tetratricopeptide (TPR) repeat protein